MALDPTTFTKLDDVGLSPSDPTHVLRFTIPGDSSYPTGGYTGFKALLQKFTERGSSPVHVEGRGVVPGGPTAYYLRYVNSTDKLMVLVAATGLEAANATDLSTATFDATAWIK